MRFGQHAAHEHGRDDQLFDVRQSWFGEMNVSNMERWVSMLAGGLLAGYAFRRRSPGAGLAALVSAGLLFRGGTGFCPVYGAAGVNTAKGTGRIADAGSDTRARLGGSAGLHVDETVTIKRPIDEVYRFWRNFENLPQFMHHLEKVTVNADGTSTWVAKGPAGVRATWTARVINEEENRVIGWQSVTGSTVATAGSVHFSDSALGTTVRVRFQYDPPAGKAGAAVLSMFGEDARQMVHEDLERLKTLLESGPSVTTARYSPAPPVH